MKTILAILVAIFFLSAIVTGEESDFDGGGAVDDGLFSIIGDDASKQHDTATLTFDKDAIATAHALSLPDFLREKGVDLVEYSPFGKSSPQMRGLTGRVIKIYLDGVLLNSSETGEATISAVDISSISQIQICKNEYAIYLKTATPPDAGLKTPAVAISATSDFLTYCNAAAPLDTTSHAFKVAASFGEENPAAVWASARFLWAKNDFSFDDDKSLGAGRLGEEDVLKGFVNVGATSSFFDASNKVIGTWTALDALTLGKNTVLEGGSSAKRQDAANLLSFRFVLPCLADVFSLDGGASYKLDARTYEGSDYLCNDAGVSFGFAADPVDFFEQKVHLDLNAAFLQSADSGFCHVFSGTLQEKSVFYLGNFTLELPVALGFSGNSLEVIPGFVASFASPLVDLSLNLNRIVRFPSLDDMEWQDAQFVGNSDLDAESGCVCALSFCVHSVDFGDAGNTCPFDWQLGIDPYATYYGNKIQWASDERGKWKPVNGDSALLVGGGLQGGLVFHTKGGCSVKIDSYTEYLYTRLLSGQNEGSRIMWTPDFTGRLAFTIDSPAVDFAITSNYVGKKYVTNLNIESFGKVCLVDLLLCVKFGHSYLNKQHILHAQQWAAYLKLANIGNFRYCTVPNYREPGLCITLGVSFNTILQ